MAEIENFELETQMMGSSPVVFVDAGACMSCVPGHAHLSMNHFQVFWLVPRTVADETCTRRYQPWTASCGP